MYITPEDILTKIDCVPVRFKRAIFVPERSRFSKKILKKGQFHKKKFFKRALFSEKFFKKGALNAKKPLVLRTSRKGSVPMKRAAYQLLVRS